jgi:hypothetical protein
VLTATLLLTPALSPAQVNAYTKWRFDAGNTGWNPNETILNTTNVRASRFGKLWQRSVEGQIYAQPLYVRNVAIPGRGNRNVIFVATQRNNVYAFDADSTATTEEPLWVTNLGNPVPSDVINCFDTVPVIGITATPVIDVATNTMYVVPKTLENNVQKWRLHALDIRTGERKPGWGIDIQASVPGNNGDAVNNIISYQPAIQNIRPGLILHNGRVIVCSSAHCGFNYHRIHGWIFSYDANNPSAPPFVFNTTPQRPQPPVPDGAGGGIWMAGASPVVEGNHFLLITSNGPFNVDLGGVNVGNTFLRFLNNGASGFSFSRQTRDHFTPSNQEQLQGNVDLGAGGMVRIPDQPNTSTPRMIIGGGKSGRLYLVNLDNMGGFTGRNNQSAPNNTIQELQFPNGFWSSPAYYGSADGNFLYANAVGDRLRQFRFGTATDGRSNLTEVAFSGVSSGYPSSTPVVSSNGGQAGTGIVWMLNRGTGALHAFDATNVGTELYNSNQRQERDGLPEVLKFTVPTVVNGRVYVGSAEALVAYGTDPPNRGTLDRFSVAGVSPVSRNIPTHFLITAQDSEGAPVAVTRGIPLQLRLPNNSVLNLGILQLRNQSHAIWRRAFSTIGIYELRVGAGTEFQTNFQFEVTHSAVSGLNHFTLATSDRVIAGQPFKYTITARNQGGQTTRYTGTVNVRLMLANGASVSLGTASFNNQSVVTGQTTTNVPGAAILMASTGARSGSTAFQVLPQPVMRARIFLGDWQGATRPLIVVRLLDSGTGKTVQTNAVPIQDDGTVSIDVPPGVFDVALKADRWLQQIRRRVWFPLALPLTFAGPAGNGMLNGDTNGDNIVNAQDEANVLGDQGGAPSGTRGLTDLNGDGTVNQTDLDIVRRNLGQRGD